MNQKLYNPKFKEKKTAAEKKKKTRNIVIIAVILVLASVATYWMMPRTGSLEDSTLFDEATVTEVAKQVKVLAEEGMEIGVVIRCQHEDIFNMMHRI